MNCLDYRRALLTGEGETEAMRAHWLECLTCAELLKEHFGFEGDLRRALEVPVRVGFEDHLVDSLRTSWRAARPTPLGRRRFLAAAAAVATSAIGVALYAWLERDDPLALACIQFVMKDEAKSIMMGAMPRAEAARVLADSLPIERLSQIGQIRHIGPCPFNGGTAYHVVLAVPQDKVTLLVMPETRLRSRARAVHEGMYASVVPLARGSVGIIGANAAVVDSVAGTLRS